MQFSVCVLHKMKSTKSHGHKAKDRTRHEPCHALGIHQRHKPSLDAHMIVHQKPKRKQQRYRNSHLHHSQRPLLVLYTHTRHSPTNARLNSPYILPHHKSELTRGGQNNRALLRPVRVPPASGAGRGQCPNQASPVWGALAQHI